jgi:hypothetical protein
LERTREDSALKLRSGVHIKFLCMFYEISICPNGRGAFENRA